MKNKCLFFTRVASSQAAKISSRAAPSLTFSAASANRSIPYKTLAGIGLAAFSSSGKCEGKLECKWKGALGWSENAYSATFKITYGPPDATILSKPVFSIREEGIDIALNTGFIGDNTLQASLHIETCAPTP